MASLNLQGGVNRPVSYEQVMTNRFPPKRPDDLRFALRLHPTAQLVHSGVYELGTVWKEFLE